ncbi:mucin-13b, partial [Pempheris klunzingeri]|uniref:mucin-13b n=1 Tax=Pempheris klunzingeri TaxID=3127111 RepID=UPI00397FF4FE
TTEDLSTSQQQLTTPTPDPCEEEQCGDGSTCVPRADQNFECLCLAGDYYNNNTKNCENAKVFPGHLLLPGMKYTNQMTDTMSTEFLNAYRKIKSEFDNVFEGVLDYENTNVVELRPLTKPKVWALPEVNATVEIIFSASSDISTKEIEKKIENAATCADCLLANAKFAETKLCDKNPCHNKTTECSSGNGSYTCTCLEDYLETDFSNRLCIACPSGQKIQGSICVDCSYGYSGLNCSESWQLALVIIGSVLGGLLLITLTLLPIVAYKSSKKSSKKKKNADTGKPNVSHFPDKAPLVNGNFAKSQAAPVNGSANGPTAFANAGVPRIPRATANNSWDSRTNLEMTPSNSRQNLVPAGRNARLYEDQDDMNSYVQVRPPSSFYAESRPQSSHYSQVRPQNNRYEQSLHQINPYASSQGHTNPYFTNDNGRRFNY